MRILIVSDAPLVREYGSSQIALGLKEGLEELGNEVLLWSSAPAASRDPRWREWRSRSRRLESQLDQSGRFDLIDAPPTQITARVASAAVVVARSVQPEFQYRRVEVANSLRRHPAKPSSWLFLLSSIQALGRIKAGWRRAHKILCLGSIETLWMRRRFPELGPRIGTYLAAPSAKDRTLLKGVRAARRDAPGAPCRNFLWIGRWSAHKGTDTLVDWATRSLAAERGLRLTIAGCGGDAYGHLPQELRDSDRLRVVPRFRREELFALLGSHNAGLFTSVAEGWGLSLQEMLESGLPVYASESGAVRDLLPHLGSLLRPFPPNDLSGDAISGATDWRAYEGQFNWTEIAREYLCFMAPSLEKRVGT